MYRSLYPEPLILNIVYPNVPTKNNIIVSKKILRGCSKDELFDLIKQIPKNADFEKIEDIELLVLKKIENDIIWLVKNTIGKNSVLTLITTSEF